MRWRSSQRRQRRRQAARRWSQPDPADEAAAQRTEAADRYRAHSRSVPASARRADRSRSAPRRRITRWPRRRCCATAARCSRKRPARSAIRRCATAARVGGSLAHADPSADYPAVDARARCRDRCEGAERGTDDQGERLLPGSLHGRSAAPTRSSSPCVFAPVRSAAYAKLHQRASHYAIVGVAAALEVAGGVITSARIGLTGAGPSAVRLTTVEQALAGKPATKDSGGRRNGAGRF